jgi:hypothetical protein
VIESGGNFAVNLLAAGQEPLSNRFASKEHEWTRFEGLACEASATGAPLIPGALVGLACRVVALHDAGDHVIVVGQVEEARCAEASPRSGRRLRQLTSVMEPVRLIVYSTTCPWCYLAEHRLEQLKTELGDVVDSVEELVAGRPAGAISRSLRYTQSWLRPAADRRAGLPRGSTEGPPTHSVRHLG